MKTDTIHFRVSESDKEKFKKDADARGMTLSEYVLYLLRRENDRQKEDR